MNNLTHDCKWYNPFTAITKDLKGYEIDNIIIYNERGVLIQTGRGWFDTEYSSNNCIDGLEITPEIIRKIKVDFTKKDNFIIKSEQQCYYDNTRYTLYLYYKNIDYKYLGLSLDNCFLYINYQFLDYKSKMVIGNRDSKSNEIEYSDDLKNALQKFDTYNFTRHFNELEQAIKTIKKYHNDYIKQKEIENNYTTDDYKKIIYNKYIDLLENNKKLEGVQ